MNEELLAALDSIEKERGIDKEILFEAIEVALMSAYKRNFNNVTNAKAEINRDTGEMKVFRSYDVVEEVNNPQTEMNIEEARNYDPEINLEEVLEIEVTPKDFGRIAAQTAKQVVIQRIREAEREIVYEEYVDRVTEVVTGVVQRFEQKNIFIDLGRTEAILPPEEQIPYERPKQGERIKVYILDVQKTTKGPQIIVSRAHPGLMKRLFEMEVPEIYDGIIEVKGTVREPGHRSKIAVISTNKDVDSVGSLVGPKGTRVQSVTNELRGEKIDIIQWSENPEEFIKNSLSPARVSSVNIDHENNHAQVIVPDNQLSLAIGREGQNARLAAKISGWKIDIISESQVEEFEDNNTSSEAEEEDLIDKEVKESLKNSSTDHSNSEEEEQSEKLTENNVEKEENEVDQTS